MDLNLAKTEGIVLLKTAGCNRCVALKKRFIEEGITVREISLEEVENVLTSQLIQMGATQPGMMPVIVVDGAIAIDGSKFFQPNGLPVKGIQKIIDDFQNNPFAS